MTVEELKEMAIFLTHYVGFPLGSKVDGVVKQGGGQAKEGCGEGSQPRTRRATSTPPSRCTWDGTLDDK